jgi:hypothetical protein
MEEYQLLGARITELAGSFEEGWTGDAAGAAQRGAGPLAVEHARASEEMTSAATLLDGQVGSFGQTKNAVVPVPTPPSAPSTMQNIVTFGSASSNYENKMTETNAAARTNTIAMDGWTTESSYNETGMPKSYGALSPTTVPIALDPGSTPQPIDTPVPVGGPKASGSGSGDSGTGLTSVPGDTGQSGAQTPPGGGQTPVPPSSHSGSGNNPGGLGSGSSSGSDTTPSSVTTPGGYTPGSLNNLSFTPGGSSPGSGASGGGAPSSGGQFGGGAVGGFGSSPGIGGAAGGNLAEGKGSGSAAPGAGTGAGAKPGGVSGSGAAGKPGSSGGPMGGGGQKGQGSEDEEHQRKYVIDDDSAFQLNDEDGQKVIDPRTGLPLVPPVIGT